MNFNNFSNSKILVSEIGLGGAQLGQNAGNWTNLLDKAAIFMIHKSLELGINFFDTAPIYGYGLSETRLGKALKNIDRTKIIINTKFGLTSTGKINFDANKIRTSLEGSLGRLKMDYVDSFIIHNPPFQYLNGNNNPHYEILERLIEEGKINSYGASLDSSRDMKLFMNTTNCGVIEPLFNILHQETEASFDIAKKKNISLIVKAPLDSGWLSGKYNSQSIFKDSRKRWSKKDIQTRAKLISKIKELIPPNANLSQMAISFCLWHDAVTTVIPGNKNISQLENNSISGMYKMSDEIAFKLKAFYLEEVNKLNLIY